ncbi:MAG TPA: methyltransferase domain-containing protein [Streptosporangiaceae bacterium]|nr:methyltransferase domain-containing protein [Streptosporangiaceae bacterium]
MSYACRACRGEAGAVVLDLGDQPACDYFPRQDDLAPDPVYPLRMWLCARCGLAQLVEDPTMPEEPRGTEPAALVAQAADAVGRIAAAGLLPAGRRVAEYGSPHGGSWLELLSDRGLTVAAPDQPAEVVVDCFGLMHGADQAAALAERAARVAPGGVLLLQYHALSTIVAGRQWNALRHGHYAYYSTSALTQMLAACSFSPRTAWEFELYGGTVLLAAQRDGEGQDGPDATVTSLLARDEQAGVTDPVALGQLQASVQGTADWLHDWLASRRSGGHAVLGYGAASRAISLLRTARADAKLLPAVVDSSPAKQGLRIPGTDIPIASPAELTRHQPVQVVLFVDDLLPEVRRAFPEVEAAGGQWVTVQAPDPALG